ncbi:MAG: PspC domain-containing protein [Microgenomates group bacterium]
MTKTEKRLVRTSKNKMLGGVAAGIGNYFDLDPNIIRFLFIVLTVFGGSGVLMYLLLWLLLPSDTSETSGGRDTMRENIGQMKETVQGFAEDIKKEVTPETTEAEKKPKSQGYLGVVLVVLGVGFLLINLGLLDMYVVRRFWPVLLVFLGVSLLSRNEN